MLADALSAVDGVLIDELVSKARRQGLELSGPNGLLAALTKRVLESALEGEITEHLGYERHDAVGRGSGNSRNGSRAKTVLTDIGPVEIEVPRDRDGSFEPQIVAKRQRRLPGVEDMGEPVRSSPAQSADVRLPPPTVTEVRIVRDEEATGSND